VAVRLLPIRRDPFWDVDGTAARRVRRRHGFVAVVAFAAAFAAVLGAVIVWAGLFGIALPGVPTVGELPGFGLDFGSDGAMAMTGIAIVLLFVTLLSAAVGMARVLRGPTEA
jgi:hypothetical protein